MSDAPQRFAELLVRHDRELLRYILTLIPRRDDAEEVLQRTAVALWEKFNEYDPQREFVPWAVRFAYFEVLNFRKEQARNRLVFSEEVMALLKETHASERATLDRRRAALAQCLAALSSDDRSLLERRYADAATVRSLAEERGRTVKSLYRRLDRLRELITACVDRRVAAGDIH